MTIKGGVAVLVLLVLLAGIMAAAGAAGASASGAGDGKTANNDKIIVTHDKKPGILPLYVSGSVTQGETDWWTRVLSGYATTMEFDLYWGNPSNSLSLKIHAPDGTSYGPYYDNCDGSLNGYIPVTLYKASGLPQGTYYAEIYGYSVSGTQSYTLY